MCNCEVGCCANQLCGILFGALNSVICICYIIALISLAVQCGEPCYPHYFTPNLYILIMVASAIMLYITGYILSWVAYKRGEGDILGCNICVIILVELILLIIATLLVWNMFDLMTHVHLYHYPQLYSVMVIVNVVWNILLIVICANILGQSEEDKKKQSFTELSPIIDDNEDMDSMEAQEITNDVDSFDDDDQWRQESGPRINAYDDSDKWIDDKSNEKLNTKKKTSTKKESTGNGNEKERVSAYDSGYKNNAYGGKPFGDKEDDKEKKGNPFGAKSVSDNAPRSGVPAYDKSNSFNANNAWA